MSKKQSYYNIFSFFESAYSVPVQNYINKSKQLKLPILPQKVLIDLLTDTLEIFRKEPILLKVEAPFVVVGDIHGHLLDLFRILSFFISPRHTKFLFLGDIVDRGEFSIECIILIFVLKILFPDKIYVIRGNHEFEELNANGGFHAEIRDTYGDIMINNPEINNEKGNFSKNDGFEENDSNQISFADFLIKKFTEVFNYMPIAAISDKFLFLHGGIGPSLKTINDITEITRPIETFTTEVIKDIFWSDPTLSYPNFLPSTRGYGYYYGINVVTDFLLSNKIERIIRGHQCVDNGIEKIMGGRVITVFSASNYCGDTNNKCGVLIVTTDKQLQEQYFEPLQYVYRNNAYFCKSESESVYSMSLQMPAPKSIIQKPRRRDSDVRVKGKLLKPQPSKYKSNSSLKKASSASKAEKLRLSKIQIGKPNTKF